MTRSALFLKKWGPVLVLLLAFGLQLGYLAELQQSFPAQFFSQPFCSVDGQAHANRAAGLLSGAEPGDEPFEFIPLYPFYLAGLRRLLGESLLLPVYGQALLQLLGIAALYRLGRLLFSPLAGLLAMAGLASYSHYLFYLPCYDQALLTVPFFTLAMLFLLCSQQTGAARGGWMLAAGLSLAVATLSRPTLLALYPLLAGWLLWRTRPLRQAALHLVILGLPLALLIAPITAHNYRTSGRFILLSDNFAVNVFTGNNPDASGLDTLAHVQSQPAVVRYKEVVESPGSPVIQEAVRYITAQPADWLALTARKTWLWFAETDERLVSPFFPLTAAQSPLLARLPLDWQAVAVAGLLGLLLVSPAYYRPEMLLLWLIGALFSAVTIFFFIQLRFRLPFLPLALLFAAALIAEARLWMVLKPWLFWVVLAALAGFYLFVPSLWLVILLFAGMGLAGYREQGRRGAGSQGSRFAGEQGSRGAGSQGCRVAGEQRSRDAEARGRRGAGSREQSTHDQPTNPPTNQPATHPPTHPTSHPPNQPTNQLTTQLTHHASFITLLLLYLLLVGLWRQANAAAIGAEQSIDHYLGPPLAGPAIFGQTFQMSCDGFNQIELTLGVFGEPHDQPVTFYLAADETAREIIDAETFDGAAVRDYQRRRFTFPAIADSAGRRYFFFVASPASTLANALTVRGYSDTPVDHYPGGQALAGAPDNLRPIQADFAFTARCQMDFWQKLARVFPHFFPNRQD